MKRSSSVALTVLAMAVAVGARAETNVASGEGLIQAMSADGQAAEGSLKATRAYAYATGEGDARRIVIVLTDIEPPRAAWDDAGDRGEARVAWCDAKQGSFRSFEIKASGEAQSTESCGSGGARDMGMVNEMNGLRSIVVKLEANDGKRVKGSVETGEGACGVSGQPPKYCTPTGSYTFDAELAKPPLVDRIWSQGNADAPELAAARKALQEYWDAAGKATKITDLVPRMTADRAAQVASQQEKAGEFAERMFKNAFVPAHAGPVTVGEGRFLAGAAVLTTTNSVTRRDKTSKQSCRVFMRLESGAWKVDKESCKSE